MTSLSGKLTITMHILHNITKSKNNQAVKIGQLRKKSEKYFPSKVIQKMTEKDKRCAI